MNDLLLLATLLDGPKHGYALKARAGLITGRPDLHNNLVYPLLRRFVANGWVTQRQSPGERGQTRQVYSLTLRGRAAIVERLRRFTEKESQSASAFHLRVGLFEILDPADRAQILAARTAHLESRLQKFLHLQAHTNLGPYGGEVVRYLCEQLRAEFTWIKRLERRSRRKKQQRVRSTGRKSP
jgi:DNA-binding PadR family transcriptional regulator